MAVVLPPTIAVSCGDVNGIGLRCFAEALVHVAPPVRYQLAICPDMLQSCIEAYGLPGSLHDGFWVLGSHQITIDSIRSNGAALTPGQSSDDVSRLAVRSLERAIDQVVRGSCDALLTLPINKHALQRVGWPYPGQTEMVAAACGPEAQHNPLMVLCTRDVRVALATVHIPLREVADAITQDLLVQRLHQLRNHLQRDLNIAHPRIAVLALNPHAGDHGAIGDEDDTIVRPAIALANEQGNEQGIDATGPLPADGFFAFGAMADYDGILAMYHDQGLIPLKVLAQGAGVNVTAGLPIVRTSPDHGTAYDRVFSTIDARSTALAIEMAVEIVQRRNTSISAPQP